MAVARETNHFELVGCQDEKHILFLLSRTCLFKLFPELEKFGCSVVLPSVNAEIEVEENAGKTVTQKQPNRRIIIKKRERKKTYNQMKEQQGVIYGRRNGYFSLCCFLSSSLVSRCAFACEYI